MQYAALTLALATTVLAQDVQTGIPKCAEECVNVATVGDEIGGCSMGDIQCICSNDAFLDNIACCLSEACDAEGQDQAMSFARSICSGAGVTDLPESIQCVGTRPSGSGTETGVVGTEATSQPEDASDQEDDSAGARAVPVVGGLVGGVLAVVALL